MKIHTVETAVETAVTPETAAVPETSSMYIRQRWLHDELLGYYVVIFVDLVRLFVS